jgi:membrane-associated phospholipid phosphatase
MSTLGHVGLAWAAFLVVPGPKRTWLSAEALAAVLLTGILSTIAVLAQYVVLPLRFPLIDNHLLAWDRLLGVDTPAIVAWTADHPWIRILLTRAYVTMAPQMLLIVVLLRALKDRGAIWEYVFHFHFCLITCIVVFGLWPAAGVYTMLDYTTLYPMTRPPQHIEAFRSGLQHLIPWGEIDGLVSMPSFHTAVACFVTWAVRRRWWFLVPIGIVNLLLILATVMLGVHYAVDAIAAIGIFAISVVTYRRLEGWLWNGTLEAAEDQAPASTPV